jgi:hypothetical protein
LPEKVTQSWVTTRPNHGHGREIRPLGVDRGHPQWLDLSLFLSSSSSTSFFFFFLFAGKVIEGGQWVVASGQMDLYLVA